MGNQRGKGRNKAEKEKKHGSYPPAIKSVNGTSPINGYKWKFYWENRENHQWFILHWDVTKGQKAWTPGSWGSSCWWLLWKIVLSSATWLDMLKGKYVYIYIYITCCVKCGRNHDFFPSQLHWFRDLFHPKLGFPPNRGTFRGLCTRGRVQLDNQSLGHCSCASLSVVYETGYASRTWMI